MNLTYNILSKHLLKGEMRSGEEILIKVDQTLTQDTTGTMVYLQLEALKPTTLKTDLSVAYIDHNTLQLGFENADDHEYIRSMAEKHGIIYSKPGNGICHQLHLERFAKPGCTLLGSDSHTPTAGGIGAIAIGSGGLDVAVAMAKGYYFLKVPKVFNISLHGKLNTHVSAKDIILHILQKLSVSGGVGYIVEYSGGGLKHLSVSDRATICNMGAELGATTSIFPSDEQTRDFLKRQNRLDDFQYIVADDNATYDNKLIVDLDKLIPLVAKPHSPDNVVAVKTVKKIKVNQIAIGSCTNSSYNDLMTVANLLKNKRLDPSVNLLISPGSNAIVSMMTANGAINDLMHAGARVLEPACGPCIGMGQAPISKGISIRTFNRNFKGRCGTESADVYLVSPETAAASAITGYLTDPSHLDPVLINVPEKYHTMDHLFIHYSGYQINKFSIKGPNIKDFPLNGPCPKSYNGLALIKTGNNISTDAIVPSTSKLLPLRSNIPELAKYCFKDIQTDFYDRAIENGGMIIGGTNYGQGSSREHAALVPLYLGIKVVIAKSFSRIHKRNLINSGILPLVFVNMNDYEDIFEFDMLTLPDITLENAIEVINERSKQSYQVTFEGSIRDKEILIAGGYINYEKQ